MGRTVPTALWAGRRTTFTTRGARGARGARRTAPGVEDEALEGAGGDVTFGGGDGGDDDVNFGCDGDAACDGWGWGV